jgi:DNA polymerase-3 subunit epsilon
MKAAIAFLQEQQPSVVIVDKGRNSDEKSCILMEKGRFYGMGYIPTSVNTDDVEQFREYLTPYAENEVIISLLRPYAGNTRQLAGSL